MGIFDDVVVNAKSAVNVVGKKAEQLVDMSKLKYAESGINHEIEKKLQDMGSFVYESTIAGEMDKKILESKVTELTELYQQLEMTREMLAAAKNKKSCKTCGSLNEKTALFCNKCGAKLCGADAAEEPQQTDRAQEPAPQEPMQAEEPAPPAQDPTQE